MLTALLDRFLGRTGPLPQPKAAPPMPKVKRPLREVLAKARAKMATDEGAPERYAYPVKAPELPPGVVPSGSPLAVAMDSAFYQYAGGSYPGGGFPGYPYLAQLSTRAEFRQMVSALATELTREWIEITGSDNENAVDANGLTTKDKVEKIKTAMGDHDIRGLIRTVAEHDGYFGRGHVFIKLRGHDNSLPLVLAPQTVAKGSLVGFSAVEATWTTPVSYNSNDPTAPDFYRPSRWFILGRETHASRLLTVISRPVPDILKPAFNFGGLSLTQLAEAYVDNWLRTRQSVSDLVHNFSITALATSMDQVLQGDDDGDDLYARADLFNLTRSNRGLMLLDKENEELIQVNTPLSGLHELQAQSQEQMCSVSRMPATVLTGIQPSGLNSTSEGEMRAWYDWVAAQQEAHYRHVIDVILKVLQLDMFGSIDPAIGFEFVPLYQMTPKEEAEIREADSRVNCAYIDAGVVGPIEVRERLARDPKSGYHGIDADVLPEPPGPGPEDVAGALKAALGGGEDAPRPPGAMDSGEWHESDHPRAANGQFGSGGAAAASKTKYGEFDIKRGMLGGAQLISSQDYLDDDVVSKKSEEGDYAVQISPEFEVGGDKFRVILDGHHSLAAAMADGKTPDFVELDSSDSDHVALLEAGKIDDFLDAIHMGDDYRNRITGKSAF